MRIRTHTLINIILAVLLVGAVTYLYKPGIFRNNRLFSKAPCYKCNVIVVTLDTLGADHMGLYGYNRPTTPFLDEFGKTKSLVFDRAIAQGSFTPTSHVSILTGKYPAEYGIFGATDKLMPEAKTLAEAMKENGYTTHAVSAAILIQPKWGWGQGFDSFEERWFVDSVKNNDAEATFGLATEWINNNKKKPFFLFINTNHLHSPHTPAGEQVMEELGIPSYGLQDQRDVVGPHMKTGGPTKADLTLMRDYYDGLVRELDTVVSKFIGNLEKQGLMEDTIVIFEGDHSEQFGEHGIVGWYGVYDTQIHVPLIVYVPGQKSARVPSVVELRSIPATVLDLIGATPDPSFTAPSLMLAAKGMAEKSLALTMHALSFQDNMDMLAFLLSKAPSVWEAMKVVDDPAVRKAGDVPKSLWYSATNGRWHLIKNDNGKMELYDLTKDPKELNNQIDNWDKLSVEDRKSGLDVFKALSSDLPASCGLYCPR